MGGWAGARAGSGSGSGARAGAEDGSQAKAFVLLAGRTAEAVAVATATRTGRFVWVIGARLIGSGRGGREQRAIGRRSGGRRGECDELPGGRDGNLAVVDFGVLGAVAVAVAEMI